MLNFTQPVQILNATGFSKKVSNAYFELESEIIPQGEMSYLLKVKLVVKQMQIPKESVSLLNDMLEQLEYLNNFSLELAAK